MNPSSYDVAVIGEFLCQQLGVKSVDEIEPFGKRQYACDVCREVVLPVEAIAQGVAFDTRNPNYEAQVVDMQLKPIGSTQPRNPFVHPVTGVPMSVDLRRVSIYNIACRNYGMSVPGQVGVRLNYYPESMAALQDTRQQDEIFAAASGIRGAFAILAQTKDGESHDMVEMPMMETGFAYQNSAFIKTMMLLNETNIQIGLIHIPHDVCRKARLPVWHEGVAMPPEANINAALQSMQATRETAPILRARYIANYQQEYNKRYGKYTKTESFVAMPINHVLAWPFHSEAYRESGGQRVEEFRTSPTMLYYYLVPHPLYLHSLECWRKSWSNKVDCRPLEEVGFQLLPVPQTHNGSYIQGNVRMRAFISYIAAPDLNPATINGLAPALAVGFPSCYLWSREDMQRDAEIKAMLASNTDPQSRFIKKP